MFILEEMEEREHREINIKQYAILSQAGILKKSVLHIEGKNLILTFRPNCPGFGNAHFLCNTNEGTYTYVSDAGMKVYSRKIPNYRQLLRDWDFLGDWIFNDWCETDLRPFGFGPNHTTIYKQGCLPIHPFL